MPLSAIEPKGREHDNERRQSQAQSSREIQEQNKVKEILMGRKAVEGENDRKHNGGEKNSVKEWSQQIGYSWLE